MIAAKDLFDISYSPFPFDSKLAPWEIFSLFDSFFASFVPEVKVEIPEGVFLKNRESVWIGLGAQIEPGVLIEGPCFIGEGVLIRHGAYIRAGSILGKGAEVGHASEVKRSLLMGGAVVSHFCYVGDSIVGHGVNLGAGVKCANLRLDHQQVTVTVGEVRKNTGLRKLGAFLGDGVQVGCNAVLNPGTILYPGARISPLSSVRGEVLCGK